MRQSVPAGNTLRPLRNLQKPGGKARNGCAVAGLPRGSRIGRAQKLTLVPKEALHALLVAKLTVAGLLELVPQS